MASSADIALLFRISELSRCYGLKPSEADAVLGVITGDGGWGEGFQLSFSGTPIVKQPQMDKMMEALGCNDAGNLITSDLGEMEDIVDRALALAPRARNR